MSNYSKNCEITFCVIKKRSKFNSLRNIYAGLIVCFVPSVLCDSDVSKHLTYDRIFNTTNYAQLQHHTKSYNVPTSNIRNNLDSYIFKLNDEAIENELQSDDYDDYAANDKGGQLLVGFSRDPFRYSVPENDYLNGVRHINPQYFKSKNENRGKRGVFHLYNMIYCATGCEPLAYKGYGCYCGFLGAGRPTDGIDRCCKMHDECYENIYCPFFTVYFQPYYWKCHRGQPLCALENYKSQHQFINGCAAKLCDCDRRFAMCVKKHRCPRSRALCRSSPIRLLQNLLMFR